MKRLFTFFFVLAAAFSVYGIPDSLLINCVQVDTSQTFRTGYMTTFGRLYFGSFFEDPSGGLHISYVDNYELFYFKSEDGGNHWTKTKIITGHEGDIFSANIVADNTGNVFIGFSVHDSFNYANPTGVSSGSEFNYKLYCVNNKSGSWVTEYISSYESSNAGPRSAILFTDALNNVHLIANRYGWYSYGGVIWEWIRYSSTNSWGNRRTVVEFNDANIDQFIYDNFTGVVSLINKYALVLTRTKGTNLQLFYILGEDSTWSDPVVVENNIASLSAFSIAYTPSDNLYIAYLVNTTPGKPVLKISKDFGTPQIVPLNVAPDDTLLTVRLFCNSDSLLSMTLWRKNKPQSFLFSKDGINWSDPELIDSSHIYHFLGYTPRTNTVMGSFSKSCKHIGVKAGQRAAQPYGPDTLTFGSISIIPVAFAPGLIYPVNGSTLDTTSVKFTWQKSVEGTTFYWFEIADNQQFTTSFIDSTSADTFLVYSGLDNNKTYYWRVKAKNLRGWGPFSTINNFSVTILDVKDYPLVNEYYLGQNYPNPFNPSTFIEYSIKERVFVKISVLSLLGEEIDILLNSEQDPGKYKVTFNAADLSSGIYLLRIKAGEFTETRKMMLLK